MNKKVFLIILLFIPFMISAKECDYDRHEEYEKLAGNITYENDYVKSENRFSIVIYNMFEDMYANYNGKKYKPNAENTVTVPNITPGSNVMIYIYADDGCAEIKVINEMEPYFNPYYGTSVCSGYEDKIAVCQFQFTSSKVTESLIEEAKKNYDHIIVQNPEKEEDEKKDGFVYRILEFIRNWGIKILLVALTTFGAITLYSSKLRKIKHGI